MGSDPGAPADVSRRWYARFRRQLLFAWRYQARRVVDAQGVGADEVHHHYLLRHGNLRRRCLHAEAAKAKAAEEAEAIAYKERVERLKESIKAKEEDDKLAAEGVSKDEEAPLLKK